MFKFLQWQAGLLIRELHFPIIDTISLDEILRAPIEYGMCHFLMQYPANYIPTLIGPPVSTKVLVFLW